MSASEFVEWQEYFSYFPFSEHAANYRTAKEISYLTFISSLAAQNKGLKQPISIDDLMPNYLGTRKIKSPSEISLEEQERAFKAFHTELKSKAPRKQDKPNG